MNPPRQRTLAFVAGTATDIGKTWWTAALARELRASGVQVHDERKPVQSGEPGAQPPTPTCWPTPPARTRTPTARRRRPLADAPGRRPFAPRAGAASRSPPPTSRAASTGRRRSTSGFVEDVCWPRSPISARGDNVSLAHLVAPDLVVLVADAGLGTIDAVRLSLERVRQLARRRGAEPTTPTTRCTPRNREHLVAVDGLRRGHRAPHSWPTACASPHNQRPVVTVPLTVGIPARTARKASTGWHDHPRRRSRAPWCTT